MIVSTLKKDNQPTLMYQGEQIEQVASFRYLGIDVPSAWGQCAQNRIDAEHAKYYQFENMCTQNIIFDTCVVQTLLE